MKSFIKRYFELILGILTVILVGLLILYFILGMISVTAGVSSVVGPPPDMTQDSFNLKGVAELGF